MAKAKDKKTLLGYYPKHFRWWGKAIKDEQGYESVLSEFLENLADLLEAGELCEKLKKPM